MSRVIYKFTLPEGGRGVVSLPIGAEVLSVAGQRDRIRLWAMVDPNAGHEDRTFDVLGTGIPVPDNDCERTFIGTVLLYGGMIVMHVFEVAG